MKRSDDKVNQTDGERVFDLVHSLMHQFRSRQFQAMRDAALPMTHMEGKVLGFFARRPAATQGDLVTHSGRDKGQIARLVRDLRDRGWLSGEPDPVDRRSVRLSLTAKGLAMRTRLEQAERVLAAQGVQGVSTAETRQLIALLERLQRNLDAADATLTGS